MSAAPAGRTRAFISYSHKDSAYLKALRTHLAYFERNGLVDLWVDTRITPGQRWSDEIKQGLTTACAAIFLLSSNFLASEFIQREELPTLLQAAEQEQVSILVVVLDGCDFANSPLAPYQAVHDPKIPLNTLSTSEQARVWVRVAGHVRKALPHATLRAASTGTVEGARPSNYFPYSPTPRFHERPGEFETLESLLFQRAEPVRPGLVGVIGMGGVGKTTLAVELAYRDQDLFPDGIFWMLATGTLFDWLHRFAELAERTSYLPSDDAPGQPDNELRRARHMATYLATHQGALLILDNVAQPTLVVTVWTTLIGRQPECTLLYTSRVPARPDGSVSLHRVEVLSEEAALQLFLEDLRPVVLRQTRAVEPGDEALAARALCLGVGYLPLGLVHLRRQLENDPLLSIAGLEQGVRDLGNLEIASADYPDAPSLFATFAYSWHRVEDVRARQLFYLAGFFPEARPIPLWLLGLATGLGERGDTWGPLREARLTLQNQSLLEPLAEGQVRLHPLVREFARRLVAHEQDQGQGLAQQAGARLVAAFWHLGSLEQRARREGYRGCLEQVRAAARFAALLRGDQRGQLTRLERWLDRKSHVLGQGKLWPKQVPGLFYQLLANLAVEEGQPAPEGNAPVAWVRQLAPVGAEDRRQLRVLQGHLNSVHSVAFSPDGRLTLTGSRDKTARLWEVETGQEVLRLEGHQGEVTSVAFSPDGKLALTGANDRTARLWEVDSGREVVRLESHRAEVTSVAFSFDGKRALTGLNDKTARIWEVDSGREVVRLEGHLDGVKSVAFSPDGKRVLTGATDGTARVWEVGSGQEVLRLEIPYRGVWAVTFSPDGQRMLASWSDHTARILEVDTGREIAQLFGAAWSVAFSPDGRLALTGSDDGAARVWEMDSGREVARLEGHQWGEVWSVAFSPDGRLALTGSADGTARIWEVDTRPEVDRPEGHQSEVSSVAFSRDGRLALTGSWDKTARVWEVDSGREVVRLEGQLDHVNSVAFSPDGRLALTGSDDGTARVWEVDSGREVVRLEGQLDHVSSVAFSPDGRLALTGSPYSAARVWEVDSGREVTRLVDSQGHSATSVAFSSDGKLALIGTGNLIARVWEVASGQELALLEGHQGWVTSVAFSPDGQLAICCDDSGCVSCWDWRGRQVARLMGLYLTAYEVKAIYWQDQRHLLLADDGGPRRKPNFYRLKLEGMEMGKHGV